ncbi:tetratricopeptide repeat protein [Nisaea sp.]|uniref:tetratricopeptide repeat protein n=1 Tax=Nisaea sp. TaxID=2024842 RepID=UPI003B51A243
MTDETPQSLLQQALQKHQAGDLVGAAPLYQQVLKLSPHHPDALHLLGFLLHQAGQSDEGLKLVSAAVASVPLHTGFRGNQARILRHLGRDAEADEAFRAALIVAPDDPDALRDLAATRRQSGQIVTATAFLARLLHLTPADPAVLLAQAGNLIDFGRHDAASKLLRKCLLLAPALIEAANSFGFLQITIRDLERARIWFNRTLAVQPLYAAPRSGLAEVCFFENDLAACLRHSEHSLRLTPDDPQIHVRHGLRLLAAGHVREGWREFEWRLKRADRIRREGLPPRWQGEQLAGKRILVCAEEGVGDELLYASMIPDLIALGASVVIECAPRLLPVFRRSFPDCMVHPYTRTGDRFRPVHDYGWLPTDPPVDYAIDGGSLPSILRPDVAAYEHQRPYLTADAERVGRMRDRLAALPPGPRIGFSWRSKEVAPFRNLYYTELADWRALLTDPDLQIVSMQYGRGWREEISAARKAFGARLHVIEGADLTDDFEDIFALGAAVDGIICPSTTLVWVGAGLGKTVMEFGVEPHFELMGTDRHPGFPTVRVFTKPVTQSWESVTGAIAAAAKTL